MDFNDRELKVVLQALYRLRGEVSGFSQSEQNKRGLVETVIGRIETKVGPLAFEKTKFDREMEESLSVLKTGRAGVTKPKAAAKEEAPAKSAAKKVAAKAKAPIAKKAAAPKAVKRASAKPAAAKPRKSK